MKGEKLISSGEGSTPEEPFTVRERFFALFNLFPSFNEAPAIPTRKKKR